MFLRALLLAACVLVAPAGAAFAASSPFSPASLIATLQGGGFAAKTFPLPHSAPGLEGAVATTVNGAKVVIFVGKCDGPADGEVCSLYLSSTFTDDKNLLSADMITRMNGKMTFSKATLQAHPGGGVGFFISYAFPTKGLTDPHYLLTVLQGFSMDLGRAVGVYKVAMDAKKQP
ncbi:hypothetical protein GALL_200480 [mine drainage metagenome]|uniref:Uncharacterized protein n=1 Tax=mine drainage metagenome TaxID=410659 RepID=A0A1J5RQH4_9ZZZZ